MATRQKVKVEYFWVKVAIQRQDLSIDYHLDRSEGLASPYLSFHGTTAEAIGGVWEAEIYVSEVEFYVDKKLGLGALLFTKPTLVFALDVTPKMMTTLVSLVANRRLAEISLACKSRGRGKAQVVTSNFFTTPEE